MKNLSSKEISLLLLLAEYRELLTDQIAHINNVGRRAVQKRINKLMTEGLVDVSSHYLGLRKGRPENVISLNDFGFQYLKSKGKLDGKSDTDNLSVAKTSHDILLNWFRIHLLKLDKDNTDFQTEFISSNSLCLPMQENGFSYIAETIKIKNIEITFVPDGVFKISSQTQNKSLLFFLEVDMSTEPLTTKIPEKESIQQKINNYQLLFYTEKYKRYETILDSQFNGFRVLFLTNVQKRKLEITNFLKNYSHDFIWVTDQDQLFKTGLGSKIWNRGGNPSDSHSIIGPTLANENPLPRLK